MLSTVNRVAIPGRTFWILLATWRMKEKYLSPSPSFLPYMENDTTFWWNPLRLDSGLHQSQCEPFLSKSKSSPVWLRVHLQVDDMKEADLLLLCSLLDVTLAASSALDKAECHTIQKQKAVVSSPNVTVQKYSGFQRALLNSIRFANLLKRHCPCISKQQRGRESL